MCIWKHSSEYDDYDPYQLRYELTKDILEKHPEIKDDKNLFSYTADPKLFKRYYTTLLYENVVKPDNKSDNK